MKLNKRGFMLAEVVISASVISVVLISIYISLNRMSYAYDTRNRYYDIDAMQVAMNINDSLEDSFNFDQNYLRIPHDEFIIFYEDNTNSEINAYYVKNKTSLTSLHDDNSTDVYLKEYIDYLKDNVPNDFKYLIIVELKKESDTSDNKHYYTLKINN